MSAANHSATETVARKLAFSDKNSATNAEKKTTTFKNALYRRLTFVQ